VTGVTRPCARPPFWRRCTRSVVRGIERVDRPSWRLLAARLRPEHVDLHVRWGEGTCLSIPYISNVIGTSFHRPYKRQSQSRPPHRSTCGLTEASLEMLGESGPNEISPSRATRAAPGCGGASRTCYPGHPATRSDNEASGCGGDLLPTSHSTQGLQRAPSARAGGSNELVGSVGPSALCTRGAPVACDVARPTRPGSRLTRNVR
jgi:hypothetical protein